MTDYVKQFAKVDLDENLVMPIEVTGDASIRGVGKCCLKKGVVDREYCAKKQFGRGNYKEVKFEKGIPLYCFTNKIINRKAEIDQEKLDTLNSQLKSDKEKLVEYKWINEIKSKLDINNQGGWTTAEKKVGFSLWPTKNEFSEYDRLFIHD